MESVYLLEVMSTVAGALWNLCVSRGCVLLRVVCSRGLCVSARGCVTVCN
jgi:hypothetical protein